MVAVPMMIQEMMELHPREIRRRSTATPDSGLQLGGNSLSPGDSLTPESRSAGCGEAAGGETGCCLGFFSGDQANRSRCA